MQVEENAKINCQNIFDRHVSWIRSGNNGTAGLRRQVNFSSMTGRDTMKWVG